MGNVAIANQPIKKTNFKLDVGNITLENVDSNEIKINCNVGSVIFDTKHSKETFSYNLDADVGPITIDGQSTSSLSNNLTLENDAATAHLQISTSVGSINVTFNK